jgi:hypothetical protein
MKSLATLLIASLFCAEASAASISFVFKSDTDPKYSNIFMSMNAYDNESLASFPTSLWNIYHQHMV